MGKTESKERVMKMIRTIGTCVKCSRQGVMDITKICDVCMGRYDDRVGRYILHERLSNPEDDIYTRKLLKRRRETQDQGIGWIGNTFVMGSVLDGDRHESLRGSMFDDEPEQSQSAFESGSSGGGGASGSWDDDSSSSCSYDSSSSYDSGSCGGSDD